MGETVEGVAVSVHRFRHGARLKLGARRLLWKHEYAVVQDEEQFELTAPDGGSAWAVCMGPPGSGQETDWATFDIAPVSADVVSILHAHADEGGFVIAVWPWGQNPIFEWDTSPEELRELQGRIDVTIRSIPAATFVTLQALAADVPSDWPPPAVCRTPEELHSELARLAT